MKSVLRLILLTDVIMSSVEPLSCQLMLGIIVMFTREGPTYDTGYIHEFIVVSLIENSFLSNESSGVKTNFFINS